MCERIVKNLFEMQDLGYKYFQSKLIPNIDGNTIIGVRMPLLRKYAKELIADIDILNFMNDLPHRYYEENILHGLFVQNIKEFDICIAELERFLPYVDNWAVCDLISPKIFEKNTDKLIETIIQWISSEHTYTIRFGIKTLMTFYSGDCFKIDYLDMVADTKSNDYYVDMMIAWYFATELAFHYDDAKKYLEQERLDKWTHNKAIQKAIESYRISAEKKCYLKKLRR